MFRLSFVFSLALFVGAFLLFWVQPLAAKALLPTLGGTPAVWNTCMLFFQGALLAGYAYVLLTNRWLSPRRQVVLHVALLFAAALLLPLAPQSFQSAPPAHDTNPAWWLLQTLLLTVGAPFFVLSATAPLLQSWFARTRHAAAQDPYFLYAASNAGSLLGLLAFPLLLEPTLKLGAQGAAWSLVYGLLVALVACCALMLSGGNLSEPPAVAGGHDEHARALPQSQSPPAIAGGSDGMTTRRRLRWVALAAVPSSLVLGVTTYLTTDIASVPLLWVIPLALYLLSFVVVFARRKILPRRALYAHVFPAAALLVALVYLSGATEPFWFLLPVHLIFFFAAALVCHGQLADDRPPARHLDEFYLLIAAGGALGGLFNALLAPVVFDRVVEYPLAFVLACLLCPRAEKKETAKEEDDAKNENQPRFKFYEGEKSDEDESHGARSPELLAPRRKIPLRDSLLVLAAGWLSVALALLVRGVELGHVEKVAVAIGVPLLLVKFFFARKPVAFALALGAVMLGAGLFFHEGAGRTLHTSRNFYGTLRVTTDDAGEFRRLYHGSTLHGRQSTDPARRCEPLSYYHRDGPLGAVFANFDARHDAAAGAPDASATTAAADTRQAAVANSHAAADSRNADATRNVAVVGLGTGATAAYARDGERWTFYELDPAVVELARDEEFFSYLDKCPAEGATVNVVLGDARLRLRDAPEKFYNLVVLDAFSSDAIPVHLLTKEAFALYLSKLAEDGWLAVHISNRSLDLRPVVAALAGDSRMRALVFLDAEGDHARGREASLWVVLARRESDLRKLLADQRWQPLEPDAQAQLWSDDFSNVFGTLKAVNRK